MDDAGPSSETESDPAPSPAHNDLCDADYVKSYGAHYYDTYASAGEGGSPAPYRWGEPIWEGLFNHIAASIVDRLQPTTVVDAGCAIGFLVKALRDRGVDAQGFDTSTWAIAQVPDALRPFCRVGSVTDELARDVDLVTCIEVLEHVSPKEAATAVANFCRRSKAILFSSTPQHFDELTHVNVRPPDYWATLFAEHRYYRDCTFDASFISPDAVLFQPAKNWRSVVADYERQRWDAHRELRAVRAHRDYLYGEVQRDIAARAELRAIMATKTFRLRAKARALLARGDARISPNTSNSTLIAHRSYEQWIERYDNPGDAALHHLNHNLGQLGYRPTFSLLMPVFNPMEEHLREAIESVLRQTYGGWQLCIADDASTAAYVAPVLEEYSNSDGRISLARRTSRGNISEASNSALSTATGEFVVLLDHDDVIPPHALACLTLELDDNPQAGLIYSDEDKFDDAGQRFEPYFKPGWNPELLLGQNYFSHLGAFRRSLVEGVGGFRVGFEGSQDYDLTLRVLERLDPSQVRHIPLVLYHWRSHRGSAASVAAAKPYAREASVRALTEHLQRTQAEGKVAWTGGWGERAVQWPLPAPAPDVRVLVRRSPSWDGARSVNALHLLTDYPSYRAEVDGLVWPSFTADDDWSGDPDLQADRTNIGDGQRRFDAVCLLGAGVEPIESGWLREMVGALGRPGVGIVGARLEDSQGAVSCGPLVFGEDGRMASPLDGLSRFATTNFARSWLVHAVASLSPGGLLIRRSLLALVGGLDPSLDDFWRTVDLCLKVRSRGLRVVWTPRARLAVKSPEMPRPGTSRVPKVVLERHRPLFEQDPSYSPNLSLNEDEAFQPAWPPRRKPPWAP